MYLSNDKHKRPTQHVNDVPPTLNNLPSHRSINEYEKSLILSVRGSISQILLKQIKEDKIRANSYEIINDEDINSLQVQIYRDDMKLILTFMLTAVVGFDKQLKECAHDRVLVSVSGKFWNKGSYHDTHVIRRIDDLIDIPTCLVPTYNQTNEDMNNLFEAYFKSINKLHL